MNMKRRKWHTKTQSRRIDDNRTNDDGNECTLVMYLNDNIIHRTWLRSRCAVHKLNKFVFTLHQLQLHYFLLLLLFQLLLQSVSGGHLQV